MFPDLNNRSLPLLILAIQGLIFAILLFVRYRRKKNISDLFLSLILFLTCYSQTCFTVGFMGWYNEFRTTKINYFLLDITLALAPLIYLYVKSVTTSNFKFRRHDLWHFALAFAFIFFRLFIFTYDALQPGFNDVQNGILKLAWDEAIVQDLLFVLQPAVMLTYLTLTLQLFYNYRKKIKQYFSNIYKLELNWLLSFLILFSLSFIYNVVQGVINVFFVSLNYEQRWWLNLFMAMLTIYIGVKGYFTDTSKLKRLSFSFTPNKEAIPEIVKDASSKSYSERDIQTVRNLMELEKAYLNPELNLSELAEKANMSRAQLSEIINSNFNKNFNDFVNSYRVEAFKDMLKDNRHKELSLLGIAQDCGFNSKATFNRVFKKLTTTSPTEYLNSVIN
ncbi:MAG: helix-turn-helix domain-containing protein [Bacteroidota bacterium]